MKTIQRIVAFCFLVASVFSKISNTYGMNPISLNQSDTPTEEQIILHGQLDLNASPDDIEAYVYCNSVHVCFHRSFGNVNVSLYNALGVMVYGDTINTAVQSTVIIPFLNTTGGTFTLILETNNGYVEGEFGGDQ